MTSLKKQGNQLASSAFQLEVLKTLPSGTPSFATTLSNHEISSISPLETKILQLNLGYMCNQTCKHCHVDAGPDRKEIMTREVMNDVLSVLREHSFQTLDLTGGAPEMNPDFRWFVEQASQLVPHIIVRCNLTIINANPKYYDLPEFFKQHNINVVSSLPFYQKKRTDRQRGNGVFDRSIDALQRLNGVGYGTNDSNLQLDLVYNPMGAFLPGDQATLEQDFKKELQETFDISFNNLLVITNLPISRFLEFLLASGNYDTYMTKLVQAFNPAAAAGVMCRDTLSVGWDGALYDCDFNQMLELPVATTSSRNIRDFDAEALLNRRIVTANHCYGCTAGAGSSCGGQTA